jgi:hypothetical protein
MILYEVKLICLETNKVIFTSLNPKPILPPEELLKKEPKPMLVINTLDSATQEKIKKSA